MSPDEPESCDENQVAFFAGWREVRIGRDKLQFEDHSSPHNTQLVVIVALSHL